MQKNIQHIARLFSILVIFSGALMQGFSSQLNKLPSLVSHYRHHMEEHGAITVADFIELHYGNTANQHREEESHEDLPFYQMSSAPVLAITQDSDITLELVSGAIAPTHGICMPIFYTDHKPQGIFQPPRA